MADLPAGTDRNTLVVVTAKEVPEGSEAVEHVVGAAWLEAFPDDYDFIRFEGESPEAAEAREEAAAATAPAEKSAPKAPAPPRTDF